MASEQYFEGVRPASGRAGAEGEMSRRQLLVRASVFGLSATAIGIPALRLRRQRRQPVLHERLAARRPPTPKSGGTVTVTALAPLSALDPVTMYQTGDIATVEQICEYLIWVENDLTLRPVLAESWSPDETAQVWTFKLRQGVTFNDGSPFGAEDVATTFDRLVNPESGSGALSALKGILSPGGTQKVDDYTVAFNLDKPFADFPYLVSSGNYNSVILPRTFSGDFAKNPVGTGPFTLVDFTPKRAPSSRRTPRTGRRAFPTSTASSSSTTTTLRRRHCSCSRAPWTSRRRRRSRARRRSSRIPTSASSPPTPRPSARWPCAWTATRTATRTCGRRSRTASTGEAIMQAMYDGKATVGNDQIFSPLYPGSPAFPDRTRTTRRPSSCSPTPATRTA